jgi:hypothetical protein
VLSAAFAEEAPKLTRRVTRTAVEIATALGLATRVTGRHGVAWVEGNLGGDAAQTLAKHGLAAQAAQRRVQAAARDVSAVATQLQIPIGFLKHGALWLAGIPNAEHRNPNDLDVLTRREDTDRLWSTLRAHGYVDCGHGRRPHHMASLVNPQTTFVEVHWEIPGMKIGNRTATLDALIQSALAREIETESGNVWIPCNEFVAAHLLVHGYVQHGGSPAEYPCMRMVGDLIDLQAASRPDELVEQWCPWISHVMSNAEMRAVLALCDAAQRATLPPDDGDARTVLDHLVLARLDEDYAAALRMWRLAELRTFTGWRKLARRLAAANASELGLAADTSTLRRAARSGVHRFLLLRSFATSAAAAIRIHLRRRPFS